MLPLAHLISFNKKKQQTAAVHATCRLYCLRSSLSLFQWHKVKSKRHIPTQLSFSTPQPTVFQNIRSASGFSSSTANIFSQLLRDCHRLDGRAAREKINAMRHKLAVWRPLINYLMFLCVFLFLLFYWKGSHLCPWVWPLCLHPLLCCFWLVWACDSFSFRGCGWPSETKWSCPSTIFLRTCCLA